MAIDQCQLQYREADMHRYNLFIYLMNSNSSKSWHKHEQKNELLPQMPYKL